MNIDLMAPRFKVIGPYPNSPYEAGGLVEITPSGTSYLESVTQEMSQWTNEIQRVDHYSHLDNIIAFPNLFQPIPWWEDRAIEDMPVYLKCFKAKKIDFVLKVERYITIQQTGEYWAFEYLWEKEPDIKRMSLNDWFPATSQETPTISHLSPNPPSNNSRG